MPVNDTNIYIYAYDPADVVKHQKALNLLATQVSNGDITISVQTVGEFYRNITHSKRGANVLSPADALTAIEEIVAAVYVHPLTESAALVAVRGVVRYQLSIWDALLWAVAKENGETVIYTEDIPGVVTGDLEGIQYINPFA